jgi:hypothetical protein
MFKSIGVKGEKVQPHVRSWERSGCTVKYQQAIKTEKCSTKIDRPSQENKTNPLTGSSKL